MSLVVTVLVGVGSLCLASCAADETEYSTSYQCYFMFDTTYHPNSFIKTCVEPLTSGTFCIVTKAPLDGSAYRLNVTPCSGHADPDDIKTAEETRRSCILGCNNGLIIGRSTLNNVELYAFDLMCPNCLNASLYKKTAFAHNGLWAKCSYCGRSYDLNNRGVVVEGDPGNKLLRYRASYSGTVLMVSN